ncbi:MAG: molecular chaperone GrpE [Parcubacteria group bacterium Gr01-1014_66]|nr:MAG: molecular chaperone GrpE [Parcubacteria group bacterium Gr01-1014_66]
MDDVQKKEEGSEEVKIVVESENDLSDLPKKISTLQEELGTCIKERREYLEGWQRAKADFLNYRKEEGRRLEELGRFVTGSLLEDMLPVLDSFDFALQSIKASGRTGSNEEQGVLMIRTQLVDILRKRGISQMQVQLGEQFNPEKHESVGEVESEKPSGTVGEEIQKGYMLGERVVRPARVRIAK